ncbi:twin-arginine translocation signal domain-containing protein [Mucilaginibacter aurantiaciroseus]
MQTDLQQDWSRRKFLRTVTVIGGAAMITPLASWIIDENCRKRFN